MPMFPISRFPLAGGRETLEDLLGAGPCATERLEAAVKKYGGARLRRAALESAIMRRQSRPKLAGYPPRVFIAYRWENDEALARARRLAIEVEALGYEVFLDLRHLTDLGPGGVEIPRYVSRLVDANVFLRVITDSYVADLAREWLLEEDQLAKRLAHNGCETVHVVFGDGGEPEDWARHASVDLRADPDDFTPLATVLPPFRGTLLDQQDQAALMDLVTTATRHLRERRPDHVLALLNTVRQLSSTFEYRQLLAHALLDTRQPTAAVATVRSTTALPGRPTVETTVDFALLLQKAGDPITALSFALRTRGMPSLFQPRFAFLVGDILDDLGQHRAALNHLRYALSTARQDWTPRSLVTLLNTIGHVLLFGLRDPAGARPYLTEALTLDRHDQSTITNHLICLLSLGETEEAGRLLSHVETTEVTDPALARLLAALRDHTDVTVPARRMPVAPTHTCDRCPAEFTVGPGQHLCGACGCVTPQPITDPCPWCANRSPSPLGMLRATCPICREGRLVTRR
ncbi:toll/interleukin-1 receptor domain-containing protein [Actinophytocola sp.]|uniref:toll/interleukin-1 receptor domain-containing protein n=1 Tax=Actinophytocola sp. TaxID=1872138 RepID=UPI002ED3A284